MTSPRAEAAAEVIRRLRARDSLAVYALERGFWPAAHHLYLIGMLERVARGECRRGMVFQGPGTAKSTYTSKLFPAWLLAQTTPHGMPWDVLACSHTANLALDFSRVVRNYVRDDPQLLGYDLSDEMTAIERWGTDRGDIYRCAGVGQGISGKRGDIGIIDDPIPGRKEADSETERRNVWAWYQDDFRQRLKPEAAILLVMTRWHEDDLAGRILPESWDGESGLVTARDGEVWDVVCLPSICDRPGDVLGREIGESVWPEWMPLAWLEQTRRSMSPRSWSAMHQQRPAPEAGDYFQTEWFGRYTTVPGGVRYFLASDFAVTDGAGDWTVHVVVGVDASSRLYVADVWRGQATTDRTIDAALDLVARYKPDAWVNEKGVILRVLGGQIRARMRERNIFVAQVDYARTTDKTAFARAIQGRWSQRMVMLPEQAPWLSAFEHELLRFPAGKHDDQVDAVALVGQHLDQVIAPPLDVAGFAMRPAEGGDSLW